MTKPYDYDDDTNDDNDHKNDSYLAAGAAPGASVPCSLFLALWWIRTGGYRRLEQIWKTNNESIGQSLGIPDGRFSRYML